MIARNCRFCQPETDWLGNDFPSLSRLQPQHASCQCQVSTAWPLVFLHSTYDCRRERVRV